MNKADIRRCMLEKRRSLSRGESLEKSLVIQQKLLATSLYENSTVIALYSSFCGEVQTGLIIEKALSGGKKVVMPKIKMEQCTMKFIPISKEDDLVENACGFKEPLHEDLEGFASSGINLIVVPGVAFDLGGNRLGMGKGYYDRALGSVIRNNIVALAYEFQVMDAVPSDSHDVPMGTIITEERIIDTLNFKQG